MSDIACDRCVAEHEEQFCNLFDAESEIYPVTFVSLKDGIDPSLPFRVIVTLNRTGRFFPAEELPQKLLEAYTLEGLPMPEKLPNFDFSCFNIEERNVSVCSRWVSECDWCSETLIRNSADWNVNVPDAYMAASRSGHVLTYPASLIDYCMVESNDTTLCVSCYDNSTPCYHCDELFESGGTDLTYFENMDRSVCIPCVESNYSYCEEHDEWYFYSCDSCDDDLAVVHDYSYKPDPQFRVVDDERENWSKRQRYDLNNFRLPRYKGHDGLGWFWKNSKAKPVVFMGFELEVESVHSTIADGVQAIVDTHGEDFLYLKRDGSLNDGFEIVSHPMTLRAHQELVDWSFLDKLSELGFRSFRTSTCGLHIHVNRTAFDSDTHMYKFSRLFADNPLQMQRIGGRDSSRWGTFEMLGSNIKSDMYTGSGNRYQAINFNNYNTLELRFFKGTLRAKRVKAALELVDAAVEYTRQLETRTIIIHGGFSFNEFALWVNEQPRYTNLVYFIEKFNLMTKDESWANHELSNEMEI